MSKNGFDSLSEISRSISSATLASTSPCPASHANPGADQGLGFGFSSSGATRGPNNKNHLRAEQLRVIFGAWVRGLSQLREF